MIFILFKFSKHRERAASRKRNNATCIMQFLYSHSVEQLLYTKRLHSSLPKMKMRPSAIPAADVWLPHRDRLCADAAFMRERRKRYSKVGRVNNKQTGVMGLIENIKKPGTTVGYMGMSNGYSRICSRSSTKLSLSKSTDNKRLLNDGIGTGKQVLPPIRKRRENSHHNIEKDSTALMNKTDTSSTREKCITLPRIHFITTPQTSFITTSPTEVTQVDAGYLTVTVCD